MSASGYQQQDDASKGAPVPLMYSHSRAEPTIDRKTSQFAEGIRKLEHEFRSERRPYNVHRWLSGVDPSPSFSARAILREPHNVPSPSATFRASHMTATPASTAPHASTRTMDGQARSSYTRQVPNEELYSFIGTWVNDEQPTKAEEHAPKRK